MRPQLAQVHPVVVAQGAWHGGLHLVRRREDGQLVVGLHEAVEAAPDDVYAEAALFSSVVHVGHELRWLGALHESLVGLEAEPGHQRVLVFYDGQTFDRRLLGVAGGTDDLKVLQLVAAAGAQRGDVVDFQLRVHAAAQVAPAALGNPQLPVERVPQLLPVLRRLQQLDEDVVGEGSQRLALVGHLAPRPLVDLCGCRLAQRTLGRPAVHYGRLFANRHAQSLGNASPVESNSRADARVVQLHPRSVQVVREEVARFQFALPLLPLAAGRHHAAVQHGEHCVGGRIAFAGLHPRQDRLGVRVAHEESVLAEDVQTEAAALPILRSVAQDFVVLSPDDVHRDASARS